MRSRLLQAAEGRFLREGFVRTSIEAIVGDAATSKREYYRCFADKEAIFLEVVERLLRSANPIASVPSGPPEKVLFDVARVIYTSHLGGQSLGLYRAAISADRRSSGLGRAVYESRARTSQALARFLEGCRERYGLVFDDAFLAALRFGFLAIDGLRFQMGARPFSESQQVEQAAQVVELFLNGHVTAAFRAHPGAAGERLAGTLVLSCGNGEDAAAARLPTRLDTSEWVALHAQAWAEFVAEGYAGASIGTITRKTKIARTTIYRHYPSKEALFTSLARQLIDRTFDLRLSTDWACTSVESALRDFCGALLERYLQADNMHLQKILLVEAGSEPSLTHAIYEHMITRVTALAKPLLRQLASAGVLRREYLDRAPRRLFLLTTFGGRFLYVLPRTPREREALVREAVDLFLYGCRRPR